MIWEDTTAVCLQRLEIQLPTGALYRLINNEDQSVFRPNPETAFIWLANPCEEAESGLSDNAKQYGYQTTCRSNANWYLKVRKFFESSFSLLLALKFS